MKCEDSTRQNLELVSQFPKPADGGYEDCEADEFLLLGCVLRNGAMELRREASGWHDVLSGLFGERDTVIN